MASAVQEITTDKPDQTKTVTPSTSQQVVEPDEGYELSSVTVNAVTSSIDSNIQAENIKDGVTILGVEGTLEEGIDTSDATATANDILSPETAYVDGVKVTGAIVPTYEQAVVVTTINIDSSINILEYSPIKNIVIYTTSTAAGSNIYISKIKNNVIDTENAVSVDITTLGLLAGSVIWDVSLQDLDNVDLTNHVAIIGVKEGTSNSCKVSTFNLNCETLSISKVSSRVVDANLSYTGSTGAIEFNPVYKDICIAVANYNNPAVNCNQYRLNLSDMDNVTVNTTSQELGNVGSWTVTGNLKLSWDETGMCLIYNFGGRAGGVVGKSYFYHFSSINFTSKTLIQTGGNKLACFLGNNKILMDDKVYSYNINTNTTTLLNESPGIETFIINSSSVKGSQNIICNNNKIYYMNNKNLYSYDFNDLSNSFSESTLLYSNKVMTLKRHNIHAIIGVNGTIIIDDNNEPTNIISKLTRQNKPYYSALDTTATVNDLLSPKTAYIGGQKVIGTIVPAYGNITLSTDYLTALSTNISARVEGQIVQDINYDFGIAVRLEKNSIRIYKVIDKVMNTEDSVLLTIPNRTFGSGTVAIVPNYIEDNYAYVVICACNAGNPATYFASVYKINLTDYTLSEELAYINNIMSISRSTESSGSFQKWQESIHFFDNGTKFICCTTESSGIGYRTVGWKFHYSICLFNIDNIIKLRNSNIQFTTLSRGDDWDNSYPRKISSYINGNYVVYKAIKNFRDNDSNKLFYTTLIFNVITDNLISKVENSDIGYDVANNILYGNNLAYDLELSSSLGSCTYTTNLTKPSYSIGKYIISYNTNMSATYMYEVNGTTVTSISSLGGPRVIPTSDNRILVGNTNFIELKEQGSIISLERLNTVYHSTTDATALAGDILSGKTAYISGGKVTGSISNNGAITITPTTSQQTIPTGYTSGGTVAAVTSAIDSNIQSGNIKSGVSILGVTGTYQPVPYTELEYIESTGTQYINTKIPSGTNVKMEIDFVNTFGLSSTYQGVLKHYGGSLFGGRVSGTNNNYSYTTGGDYDFIGIGNNFIQINKNETSKLTKIIYSNTSVSITNEDYTYENNELNFTITTSNNICIFARNDNGTIENGTFKIYSCKMWNNDVLVRDLIPVKAGINTICMYDRISQTFFYNQGTGDFVAGPILQPVASYTELQYIESTGTQYIDTGIAQNSKHYIKTIFRLSSYTSGTVGIFGAYYNSSSNVLSNSRFYFRGNDNNNYRFQYKDGIYDISTNILPFDTNWHKIILNGGKLSCDDTLAVNNTNNPSFNTNTTYYLFATRSVNVATNIDRKEWDFVGNLQISSYTIIDTYTGNTILDLIPVKRNSDSEICMYDKVSGTFFTNQGTGTFTAGPEV